MKILVPQGIGDAIWAMLKIQDIAKKHNADKIEVCLNCSNPQDYVECRSREFVSRFSFVDETHMIRTSVHPPGQVVNEQGHYVYIPDGPTDSLPVDFVCMPNPVLERGDRLERWLPEYEINWDVMDEFFFKASEIKEAESYQDNFVVFYMGMLSSNTTDGHNRGPLWTPEEWVKLGETLHEKLNTKIVLVGAGYDVDYYEQMIRPHVEDKPHWINAIGKYSVPQVFAITRRARLMISYQSGMGIVTSYLGVPLGIFWRPKGDSISRQLYISFEEKMNEVWANPRMIESGKHLPLIYAKHDLNYILEQILTRGW